MNDSLEATLDEATEWLDQLSGPWFSDERANEALAKTLSWVAIVNHQWPAQREALSDGVIEKLRKWIERLLEKLRELSEGVKAQSFSITSGVPPLAVTVTFTTA